MKQVKRDSRNESQQLCASLTVGRRAFSVTVFEDLHNPSKQNSGISVTDQLMFAVMQRSHQAFRRKTLIPVTATAVQGGKWLSVGVAGSYMSIAFMLAWCHSFCSTSAGYCVLLYFPLSSES